MRELKIYLSEQLNELFRRVAMEAFGYGRGSISKAAEEALLQWCDKRSLPKPVNQVDSPPSAGKEVSVTIGEKNSVTDSTTKQSALQSS